MAEAYRTTELAAATKERDAARERYNSFSEWCKAKHKAADDLEFWSSKVAFLMVPLR
jgi:hypothetical protein